MRQLIDLIRAVPFALSFPKEAERLSISGITADSRKIRSGSLFAALRGDKFDGTAFIPDARIAGAVAALCDMDTPDAPGIMLIKTDNPRKALAHMAAEFYGSQPEHVVAVTGTDGKTSTADFFRQFWHLLGRQSASIGTLGVLAGNGKVLHASARTTPGAIELQKMFSEIAGLGIKYVAMEASSHGLDQYRMDAVTLEAGAFTNISRDHLDYHHTEEAYFKAKARLFTDLLPEGATAVINQDDARFAELKAVCEKRKLQCVGFGRAGSQYRIAHTEVHGHGQTVLLEIAGKTHTLDVPLVGAFQIMNILAALGMVVATGAKLEDALAVVPELTGVPGRLELAVRLENGANVYIDYAHTPMALANILKTLRPHTKGQLWVVFGCGGDRDTGKRPEMGKAANELADGIIITDDNPRSEDPALIRRAVLDACPRGKEVADRKEAIYLALKKLKAGDILVIAGKGHEKTQIIGSKTLAFDDADMARQGAKELQLAA